MSPLKESSCFQTLRLCAYHYANLRICLPLKTLYTCQGVSCTLETRLPAPHSQQQQQTEQIVHPLSMYAGVHPLCSDGKYNWPSAETEAGAG